MLNYIKHTKYDSLKYENYHPIFKKICLLMIAAYQFYVET